MLIKAALLWSLAPVTIAAAAPVLMISIDGMRPDAVVQAPKHGLKLPNLERFVKEGAYAEGVIGVYPTSTLPSHTSIMTGVNPAVHGILSNIPFDPIHPGDEGNIWGRDIKAQTLWQAASAAGLKTASIHWPVTVDAPGITYNIPQYGESGRAEGSVSTHSELRLMEAISRPDGFLAALEGRLGPFESHDLREWDRRCEEFAEEIIKRTRPALMTIHFADLDGTEHKVGVFRPEDASVLHVLDDFVGRLVRTAWSVDPSTIIVVLSDHGHADVHWDVNLVGALAQAGLLTLSRPDKSGARHVVDWQVAAWGNGGSTAIYLKDPGDVEVRDRAHAVLERLKTPQFGIDRILEGKAIEATGGYSGAAFVVNWRPGFVSESNTGPLLTRRGGSSHGYFPDVPEMNASFFALGANLPIRGDLGIIDMKQIAPSIADLLGIPFRAGGSSVFRRTGGDSHAP